MASTRPKRGRRAPSDTGSARDTNAGGDAYLQRLIKEQLRADLEDDNPSSDDDDDFVDDADSASLSTVHSSEGDDISDRSSVRRERDPDDIAVDEGSENEVSGEEPPDEIAIPEVGEGPAPPAVIDGDPAPPAVDDGDLVDLDVEDVTELPKVRGRSILHHHMKQKKVVFLSLDLETGGEECGIIQLSAEFIRPELCRDGGKVAKDTLSKVTRGVIFNEYVNPGEDAEWATAAIEVTGLSPTDDRITSARDLDQVWTAFSAWVDTQISEDEVGVIVAYNGAGCDMKWLWRLCQAPNATHSMPSRLRFYMDPLRMIKKWKSMELNPKKSKLESLSLSSVYRFISGGDCLMGAHDSLVDVGAQSDIILHKYFIPYLDRTDAICTVENIFGKNKLSEMKRDLEPIRPVHEPWTEQTEDTNVEWIPTERDSHTGARGGGLFGPTSAVSRIVRTATNLATIFFFILPLLFFEKVAKWSTKYAYEDWVVEKYANDRDGNKKKVRHFEEAPEVAAGERRAKRHRHRADKEKEQFTITTGFVICWFACLIMQGALFGANKPRANDLYATGPYGINIPIMRNAMKRDAYKFLRRYVHFCDNDKKRKRGEEDYTKLFKVAYVLETIGKGIRNSWGAGKRVTIDESMIKYMGRAVPYVQYMPAKPIKHGIKVFCLCCAVSGVMLSFQIYTGKKEDEQPRVSAAIDVCTELCRDAGLLETRGRVLYTDNYYTSIKLAKHMFEQYGWTVCGTIVPTEKKHRENEDFPFLKLSNGARNSVGRGWFREAALKLKSPTGTTYYIQATTWRDKKQVCFVSSSSVGFSNGLSVKRHVRGKKDREIISGVRAQQEYSKWYNAVDRNDRDSADYSTTIRTCRYYIRIMCWALDRVIHCEYTIVSWFAVHELGCASWKRYLKNGGRRAFQIDLAIDLFNYGLALDWDGGEERPSYMRKDTFIPCDCKKCYFCQTGHTGTVRGVDTKKRKAVFHYKCGGRRVTEGCTEERVDLGLGSLYCKMCYRTAPGTLSAKDKRKLCKTSRLGCNQCREAICEGCWEKGYDKHQC